MPAIAKGQILEALLCASFGLHSGGKAVLDFAKALFGNVTVSNAAEDRKEDEKLAGMANGAWGEDGAHCALARAYCLLVEHGEDGNADCLKTIALGRFLKEDFEAKVKVVQDW